MENHTFVLSTPKIAIPESISIDFVTNLINRGVAMSEYFGPAIDNQADYVEDDMKGVRETTTYIEFHFDTEEPIEYEMLSETDVDNLIFDIIKKSANIELRADGKDITVYL
jgi:hypothetical protein